MINATCGLICLLVFVFVVHRMLKLLGPRHWGKQHLKRRHYEDQVKSKRRKKCCMWTVCARSTGLSGGTPYCPVPHAGLSGAPGNRSPMASSRWHCGEKSTGLSGVTSGVSGVKSLRANGHLQCQTNGLAHRTMNNAMSGAPPNCPVCHKEHSFSPTARFVLGPINTPPNRPFPSARAQAT
jgi:hypothetical protein